jgi:hypothetical protein
MDSNPSSDADYLNASTIQTDANGNIYYLDYNGSLIKLDISNPENITSVSYAASNRDRVGAFQITPDGHVVYRYGGVNNGMRIRSNSGAIKNIPVWDTLYWIGLDGKIYYHDADYGRGNACIKRVEIDNEEFIITNFADTDDERDETGWELRNYFMVPWMTYKLNMPDRIILVSTAGQIVEVDNPEHKPVALANEINGYTSISGAGASDGYYYLAASNTSGEPSIYKIDPITNTALALLPVGTYEVYSLSVGKDDYVYFHAMKMANGADVIGEIDSNGIVTIVSENADSREIKSLVRLY